jgi:hypothetical protein
VSRLSLLTAFLLAAFTASAETLSGGPATQRPVLDVAVVAARGAADTFRPLAPGETRFLGPTAGPSVVNASTARVPGVSSPPPRVISISTATVEDDPWTDTVVVASPRPDTSRMDVIRTGAVVRIALD